MANPHLNFFRPYSDVKHEDQLTRAALVVMRLVPLAHAEFIRLVDPALSLSALPAASFDTQTPVLHPELASRLAAGETPAAPLEVISVFLTPSDERPEIHVRPSDRSWRLDGALRYGERLVIVIENKLDAEAGWWQAENIQLGELAAHCHLRPAGIRVPWHDLLEGWMRLGELGLLNATERAVLADFFDLAGEHFADLLPFKTLARADENETRIQRRIRDLLASASQCELDWDSQYGWWYAYSDWRTFERVALVASHGERLSLELWPAHRKAQAEAFYGTFGVPATVAALDGAAVGRASIRVRPDLFVRSYAPKVTIGINPALPLDDYLEFWARHVSAIHQYEAKDLPLAWLVDEGMMTAERAAEVRDELLATNCQRIMLQPALSISLSWNWSDGVELDEDDRLVRELSGGLAQVFAALGEAWPSAAPT